jgi:hypothetical protein
MKLLPRLAEEKELVVFEVLSYRWRLRDARGKRPDESPPINADASGTNLTDLRFFAFIRGEMIIYQREEPHE